MCVVSVIIPNYNHSKYLKQRIESVLNQTFKDFELILLDDCSTDDSRDVIEAYREHPKVTHVVFNQRNSGSTFRQWKRGLELARGDYIWIAESDDYCETTLLSTLVPPFLQDSDIVLSYCQSIAVGPAGEHLSVPKFANRQDVWDGKNFVHEKMMGRNSIPNASMVVFRKKPVETMLDEYASMKFCGDWLFWVNMSLSGKVYVSGEYLNYYRRHAANVTSVAVKQGLDFIEGDTIFALVKATSPSTKQIKNAFRQRIKTYLRNKQTYSADVDKLVIESMRRANPQVHRDIALFRLEGYGRRIKSLINSSLRFPSKMSRSLFRS